MKYAVYNHRDFIKLVENNGYYFLRANGGHLIYRNADGKTITIPSSANPMICRRLIKENNLKINKK